MEVSGTTYIITQWLFIKLLGGVYGIAFWSLYQQVDGLYGSRGIAPIGEFVRAVTRSRQHRVPFIPSIFRFNSSDFFLRTAALSGVILSLLLIAGVCPPLVLLLLWLIYLSFVTVGQEFLSYQWDALLLETGFMTIFFSLATPPSFLVVFTYWFFLFRFIFSAGVVKLTSKDKTWRNLDALCFHYETQPLPNIPAWFAHQLPRSVQKFSTFGVFFFELAVPFLALIPGPVQLAGFILIVFFQQLIFLTGNYGFFNILSAVLAVPLLTDRHLQWIGSLVTIPAPEAGNPIISVCITLLFAALLLVNFLQVVTLFYRPLRLSRLMMFLMRYWISSPYGLFAVMTTNRFEFVILGSNDQREWRPYEFKWKPGDPHLPPRQAAPHQPRLDWQMWFAALEPDFIEPWLRDLLYRLLEGSPPVLSLFGNNPFPDAPPKYIQVLVYRYHFSDRETRRSTGRWWNRTLVGKSSFMSLEDTDAV